MQLEIKRKGDGQLPLIEKIPSLKIAQLEGYNGVGKSLTVRVLEICSGRRPVLAPEVWEALCKGLGNLTVTATKLRGAERLLWEIDGEQMLAASKRPGDALSQPRLDWFVKVERDGKRVTAFDQIRDVFAVQRIGGEIGLVDTLAEELEAARIDVMTLADLVFQSEKLKDVEDNVDEALALLETVSPSVVIGRLDLAAEIKSERKAIEERHQLAVRRREQLDAIAQKKERLSQIATTGADLERQIAEGEEKITALRGKLEEAATALKTAEESAASSEANRKELEKQTKKYERAAKDAERLGDALAKARELASLGEDDNPDARRSELEELLRESQLRRNEIEAGPALSDLIARVKPGLNGAIGLGLADQVLMARDSQGASWTVREVADALERRREELADVTDPEEAKRLDQRIDALRSALAAVDEIPPLIHKLALAEERQDDAQKNSEQLAKKLDAVAAKKLDELRTRRRDLDQQIYGLSSELTVLAYRRDGLGAADELPALAEQFEHLLAEVGVKEDQIEAEHAKASQAASELREQLREVSERDRAARAEVERDVASLTSIVKTFSSEKRFAWLAASAAPLPDESSEIEQQLAALAALTRYAESANERLAHVRQLFPGLAQGIDAVRRGLTDGVGQPAATFKVEELSAWLAGRSAEWFEDPEIRLALFGADAHSVSVDIVAKQVSWLDKEGEPHNKPFEGLSSGEQAFAFTRAALGLRRDEIARAKNRLIALDEFGAFVSHNRMRELSQFLTHWQHEHDEDQILLILPANKDYEELAQAASGDEAKRYKSMAKRLSENEWFIEEFVA